MSLTEAQALRQQAQAVIGIDLEGNLLPTGDNNLPKYVTFSDMGLDSFGRLRISSPISRFDSQFTYDLQPLLFEQLTNGAGAVIAHSGVNRNATMSFTNSPAGSYAYMQSYLWTHYLSGNSHLIFITSNFVEHSANVIKFAGYGDLNTNGIHFISDGSRIAWRILSDSQNGDEIAYQLDWNIDKLDGTGTSNITLDVTKQQILVIDLQALYVGRVRVGFDIGGLIIWCHEFNHANTTVYPYIQSANLPVICGMYANNTATTTMQFNCATVRSEGADVDEPGYGFAVSGTVTAGNNTRTHLLSVRPKTTFSGITNRVEFIPETVDIMVTGNTGVYWELVIGQALTTPTYSDANTAYSGFEYATAQTLNGNPAIVIESGYIPATNQSKGLVSRNITNRYPITLDAAGVVRNLGTLTLLVTGLGGTSVTFRAINWREVR